MKQIWLNKQNNDKLIVFFNGWGMDEKIVSHLDFDGFDVFCVYDYTNLDEITQDFSFYREKVLIAWSMGVFTANNYYEIFKDFDKCIAINGTQSPIDDNFGIPAGIYDLMIQNFNETTVQRFMKKMTLSNTLDSYKSRSDEQLKAELIAIKGIQPKKFLTFSKVIASKKDKIIPYKNQMNFWQKHGVNPLEPELPHYIFDKYTKWSEFI